MLIDFKDEDFDNAVVDYLISEFKKDNEIGRAHV